MKPISCSISIATLCVLFAVAARAADHGDPILVIDEAAAAVILIQPLATTQDLLWSGLPLIAPTDAILENDGALLIADPGAGAIFRFDWVAGVAPTPFLSSSDQCWLLRLGADEILTSGPGGLISLNVATGGQTQLPTALVDPFDMDFRPNGHILVADPGTKQLISVDPGTWQGAPFADGEIENCWLATAPGGQVAAVGPSGVYVVGPQGGDLQLLASGGFLFDPSAVAFGGHGDIYVADRGPGGGGGGGSGGPGAGPTIVRVDPVTGQQTVVASGGFLQAPSAILVPEPPVGLGLMVGAPVLALIGRRRQARARVVPTRRRRIHPYWLG